jgi:hypothetical protein
MTEDDDYGNDIDEVLDPKLRLMPKRSDRHNLAPLMKRLKAGSGAAVNALQELLGSSDEKIRLEAAKVLLKFQLDVSAEITNNAVKAALVENKFGTPRQGIKEIDNRPLVDFGNIKDI